MTYLELIADVRLGLSEEVEAFYTDINIQTYLNKAIKRFTQKTKCARVQETITYLNGTGVYILTNSVLKMRGIVNSDFDTPFTEISFEDWTASNDEDKKECGLCYVNNITNEVNFSPNYADGEITLEYYANATDITAKSFIDNNLIHDKYHEALTEYALYLAFRKDQEVSMANASLQSYLAWERDAIKEVEQEQVSPLWKDFDSRNNNPHHDGYNFQFRSRL